MTNTVKTALPAVLGALTLAACVPPSPEPTPVPSPTPTPMATATPTPAPTMASVRSDWIDAPQTPGDWSYTAEVSETLAVFGTGRTSETVELIIRCDLTTRRVGIARQGTAQGQVEMLVRTETEERSLTAGPVNSSRPLIVAELAPTDPLLDAIAFSRGRFAVNVAGVEPAYVPAWPEITRVVEDCRG